MYVWILISNFNLDELDSMLRLSVDTDDEAEKDKILSPFDECINYIQVAIPLTKS